jgi:hypothetical protein
MKAGMTSVLGGATQATAGGTLDSRSAGIPRPETFSWYRLTITNRSISDEAKREAVRAHLVWLASKLDDDTLNQQLITLKYDLMAETNADLAAELKIRAAAIDASTVAVEDERC